MKVRHDLLLLQGTALLLLLICVGNAHGWSTAPDHNKQFNNNRAAEMQESTMPACNHNRRSILIGLLGGGSVLGGTSLFPGATLLVEPCHAAAPLDAGEAIRRSAANIPGYGQTDVFFPSSLAGSWQMTRDVDFGNGKEPLRLVYPFRFIRSIEDDAVVADRGANQAELERAIRVAGKGNDDAAGSSSSSSNVRSYEWIQNNPNDLRLVLSDGTRKEIKTTKRATERTDTTVSSSEFQRITQEDGQRGIPSISARRVMTKWKVVDDNTLEELEIIYSMGGGDPMAASSANNASPTVLSKSRMILVRQKQ